MRPKARKSCPNCRRLLAKLDAQKARLKALVRIWTSAQDRIVMYGCPIGSLCSELDKRDNEIYGKAAALMGQLIAVAQDQFEQLGRRDARELAVTLVSGYEGAALLANTLRDPRILNTEARRLERWIDSIAAAQPGPS